MPFLSSPSILRRIEHAARRLVSISAAPLAIRLSIAAAAIGAATAFRLAVASSLGAALPYATYYLAVEISALLGGLTPGLFATAASALITHTLFAPLRTAADDIGLALFVASCALLVVMTELLHRTQRRLAEAHARRRAAARAYVADKHFRVAIASGQIGAWDLDLASNVATTAGNTLALYGLAPDMFAGPSAIAALIAPEDRPAARRDFQKAIDPAGKGLYRSEYRIRRPSDQSSRWIAAQGQTLFERGKPVRMVGVSRDVTDEKAAAQAQLDRARILEQLANVALAAPGVMGAFYLDADNRVAYRYVSPKSRSVFGLDPEAIRADASVFFKRLDRDDLDKINEGLFRSARDLTLWVIEFRLEHPEKGTVWIEAQAAPVREPDGLVVWHGYASDITQRKRAELSLAESAERLQATIDAAQDAVLTMDSEGRILSMNRAGETIFACAAEDILGTNAGALIETLDGAGPEALLARSGERSEIRGKRRNGEAFPAELTLTCTKFERKPLLVAFVKDLTERRNIERQMEEMHRTRFEAMGGMAAALTHEINQPLAATTTYLGVARRMIAKSPLADDATLTDILEKATAQTLRAGRIVTSLRNLIRRGEADKTLIDVNALVLEARDALLAEEPGLDIRIKVNCRAWQDQVVGDRTQMRQVLANLIRNAIEAMQSVGRCEIVLETSNPDDQTIRVDVIDTGCGLPDSSEERCFEPFTTTKARGMGVGLSIAHSIIEAHYGRIWATPNEGGGAIFSFALPLQKAGMD